MEYVEHADPRPEPIPIAPCRELLGDEAESMTDQAADKSVGSAALLLIRLDHDAAAGEGWWT